jgi:ferredoxin
MSLRIEVDPIRCDAHGQCAELLPERITLDEWGYPLIDGAPIPASLEGLARRTVRACPTLALRLQAASAAASENRGGGETGPARWSKR